MLKGKKGTERSQGEVPIYVTDRGGRYVKAEELLRSRTARKTIAEVAEIERDAAVPPKHSD